jgi:uncharacterized protein (DUF1330 family)
MTSRNPGRPATSHEDRSRDIHAAEGGRGFDTTGRDTTKGYLIARVTITDPERYEKYRLKTPEVIASFGGRFLVRGSPIETVEGNHAQPRIVVLEFDSIGRARAFYDSPACQEIAKTRQEAAQSHIILVEGYDDPRAAERATR